MFRNHSPNKLLGKHVKNKNGATMYAKKEKLLPFYPKLSIPIKMLVNGVRNKNTLSQALFKFSFF